MSIFWRYIETGKFFEEGIPRRNTDLAFTQGLRGEATRLRDRLCFPKYIPDEDIPESSIAFIRSGAAEYTFVQFQRRAEDEILSDYETKRVVDQIRYTLISDEILKRLFAKGYLVFYEFLRIF